MKLYMVIAEGFFHGYGGFHYFLGVFDTIEKVETVKENYYQTILKQIEMEYEEKKQFWDMSDLSFEEYVNNCFGWLSNRDYYIKVMEVSLNEELPMKSKNNDAREYSNDYSIY